MQRGFLAVALLGLMMTAWPASGASAQTTNAAAATTVYVDGQRIATTSITQNGLQLVPASFFRKLGVSVDWSEQYRSAVLTTSSIQIGLPAEQRYTDYQHSGQSSWSRDYLDTRTTLIGGSAYVPLAYTAKKIGLGIQYDAAARAAVITTGSTGFVMQAIASGPSSEEIAWLYKITEAEAGGESYTGKVAVAASILNRVDDPEWPDSIIDAIFQVDTYNGVSYYQYSPVLDKRIYSVTPSQDTIQAVDAALNGYDPTLGAVVFYNPAKTDNAWVRSRQATVQIGNHVFAK
ncbi:cell wall hydrolase [Cohnella fermenti]|nr:cell wall hydrolase [Cohnella fermenti]